MFAGLRQDARQSISVIGIALLCVLGVGLLQVPQLQQLTSKQRTASRETLEREVETEKLHLNILRQLPSFGFDNLIADWTYLEFLQYFGDDDARTQTGYSLSPEFFEIIIPRDPRFLTAYLGLSTSTSLYAAMPERSVALMAEGLKSLTPTMPPKSYYVWRYKGIDELLFLPNGEKAAQDSFEMAAQWAGAYADEESKQVEALSRQTAEFLARNPKSKSAQIAAWTMVLTNNVDNRTRQIAIKHIEALGGRVSISPEGGVQVRSAKDD